jgi:DNA repair/transcription protein MET18/MMS19
MLVEALRNCFSSNKKFTKFAMPLIIEKLQSSVDDAQLDALDTYAQCARQCYDPNDYKEHLDTLWSSFQRIAINAVKSNLEEAALNAIRALSYSIARTLQTSSTSSVGVSIDSFVNKTVQSCSGYLSEPDLKLVWPNVKCLQAVASASSTADLLVNKKVLPLLIDYYKSTTQAS